MVRRGWGAMKLLIVIPALNEEESIAEVIARCLGARDHIMACVPAITAVEVTVVSDGSTDRTVARARAFADRINLVVFEKNRGYGAAIQEGWARSDAGLLGFMDADGTCDPRFFADLCRALEDQRADIALGNRMHPGSRMPFIRRLGNRMFALALAYFSAAPVRDTASGMRVVRRTSLSRLMPLPDGLNFTPAMSARAMLDAGLRITEVDMPYHERVGVSKLRAWEDGWRFSRTIVESILLYRPAGPLMCAGVLAAVVAAALMVLPAVHYLRTRTLAEWMIYRFVVGNLLGTSAAWLLAAAHISRRVVQIVLFHQRPAPPDTRFGRFLRSRLFWPVLLGLFLAGGLLVLPSFRELIRTGATYEHWSRFIVMSFLYSIAILLLGVKVIGYALDLLADRLAYLNRRDAA